MTKRDLEASVQSIFSEAKISDFTQAKVKHFLGYMQDHDKQLYFHSLRTGIYSYLLARELSDNMDLARLSFLGGTLHDVGKLAFDMSPYSRPHISDSEYDAIKQHSKVSMGLLFPELPLTAHVAGRHHLRPNGTGYGIDNSRLLLSEAKSLTDEAVVIVGACDYLDALQKRNGIRKSGPHLDKEDTIEVMRAMTHEFFLATHQLQDMRLSRNELSARSTDVRGHERNDAVLDIHPEVSIMVDWFYGNRLPY
jgi:hypothetical protein